MSIVLDDIQLIAPGPNPVSAGQAQCTGATGIRRLYYWVVAHYPIGVSIAGPFAVINAPDLLTATDAVQIVWNIGIGVTEYDVLRTDTGEFPQAAGNYMVASHVPASVTSYLNTSETLAAFNPTGLPFGAPAMRHIYLNNRDYSQPTIELDSPLKASAIVFPDGSSMNSVSVVAGQSPWVGDVDAANHRLYNARRVEVNTDFGYMSIRVTGAGATPSLYMQSAAGNPWEIGVGGSGEVDAGKFYILTAAQNRFVIDASGNVGIANGVSPLPYLDANVKHLVVGSDTTLDYGGITVCTNRSEPSRTIGVYGFANYAIAADQKLIAMMAARTTSEINSGNLALFTMKTGNLIERMRINEEGWVGIGHSWSSPPPYLDGSAPPIHLMVGNAMTGPADYGAITVCAHRGATGSLAIGTLNFANMAIDGGQPEKRIAALIARTGSTVDSGELLICTRNSGGIGARIRLTEDGLIQFPNVNMDVPAGPGYVYKDASGFLKITG